MEIVLYIILITFGIAVLIIFFSKIFNPQKENIVEEFKQLKDIHIDENDPEGKALLVVQNMFNNNVALPLLDIYVELGMPKEIAYSKDSILISQNLPINENREFKEVFNSYCHSISSRFYLQNDIIQPIDHRQYNLNLDEKETLYYRINLTNLYEEKVTRREIFYSGARWNSGMMRSGSLSLVSHEIKNFVIQDIGRLFITDKRLIFIGKQKNLTKTISLKEIVTYYLYQDGILILQGNKKGLLFKFEVSTDHVFLQDGINEFTTVVSRILNKNHTNNLLENKIIETKSEYKTELIDENSNQELISPDPLLKEAANLVVKNQQASTSLIQRTFSIGYARSGKIIDELECLKIISIFDGTNPRKVLVKDLQQLNSLLNN
jgi:hypothetical protein